jgi:hypothetical protein
MHYREQPAALKKWFEERHINISLWAQDSPLIGGCQGYLNSELRITFSFTYYFTLLLMGYLHVL